MKRITENAWIMLLFLAILYIALFQKYRAYDVDNPWFLSFSYSLCEEHIETDEYRFKRFPNGMDGTHLFGKLAAYSQCLPLHKAGWLPRNASWISIAFTIIALGLWWNALLRMGFSSAFTAGFIFLLGVSEPIVSMAEKFRYEFFSFFLFAVAIWLVSIGSEFAAALTASIAVETQPAALAVALAVASLLLIYSEAKARMISKILLAGLIAFALYLVLHPHALPILAGYSTEGHSTFDEPYLIGQTLTAYFIQRIRHSIELVILLVGTILYLIHRRTIRHPEFSVIALIVSAFLFLMPHANAAYMVFAMPPLLLIALQGFEQEKQFLWVPILLGIAFFAEYGYLYRLNLHEGFTKTDFAKVSKSIQEAENAAHIDDRTIRIVGDFSLWFSHPRGFISSKAPHAVIQSGDLYLCYNGLLQPNGLSVAGEITCQYLKDSIPLMLISQVEVHGHWVSLYRKIISHDSLPTPAAKR